MSEFIQNNKPYITAFIIPVIFMVGLGAYFLNFEVVKDLSAEIGTVVSPGETKIEIPSIWTNVKDKNDSDSLMLVYVDLAAKVEKTKSELPYALSEYFDLARNLSRHFVKLEDPTKYFHYTQEEEKEKFDPASIDLQGIWYPKAVIGGRMMGVGDTLEDGKIKIVEVLKDSIVVTVGGKKYTVKIKK